MLIAMAGLPGAGKSTLAAGLAKTLGAVVLGKDEVRAALFPPTVLDCSAEQNDIAMAAIYRAAGYILKTFPGQALILDGRTFLRSYQVRDLIDLAAAVSDPFHIIECVCADEVARLRLEKDLTRGQHPAPNRTWALYQAVQAAAETIAVPHLVLDTGRLTPQECIEQGLAYLKEAEVGQKP